jgi:hypothetical protein
MEERMSVATPPAGGTSRLREGRWTSPGYRSSRTRALWTQGFLVASSVIAGLLGLYSLTGVGLADRYAAGAASDAEVTRFVSTVVGLGGWSVLLELGTAICFLAWLSRSVDNAPPLGVGTPSVSPRWAIGWWFIPLANLVMPYRVVRELYERLGDTRRGSGGGVVLGWWLTYVGAGILSSLVALASEALTSPAAFVIPAVAEGLLAGSAILCVLIVREVEDRQRGRAAALGPLLPLPGTPPGATAPPDAVDRSRSGDDDGR